MFPFAKILCPVDFSEPSIEALEWAVVLTRHFGGELLVVHVVDEIPVVAATPGGPVATNAAGYQQQVVDEADRDLWELCKEHVPEELRSEREVAVGLPAQAIVRLAAEHGADLILLATHGRTGWRRFISGSVTERVVREADCPVLTMQPSHREEA